MILRGIPELLRGKRVLLRLDLNFAQDGNLADDFRLRRILPTIRLLADAGAQLTIVSHFGADGTASLRPVAEVLNQFLPVDFEIPQKSSVVLLENIRRQPGEEANDENFARELASQADLYVNDAFSASHRAHASIVGVTKFLPSYAGPLFLEEIKNLSALTEPVKPLLVIVGGAKFETKLPLVRTFLPKADTIFIGGKPVTLPRDLAENKKIILPADGVVVDSKVMDAGPQTLTQLAQLVGTAKTILWNGPLGWYEGGYAAGTEKLAQMIAASGAHSVIGGGDTVAVVSRLGLLEKFSFVSTGGGAMLDFLATGTLPGITALVESAGR